MSEFKPHSDKQEEALFATKPILMLGTGTQWGKTTIGALRMRLKTSFHNDDGDQFLVTSPTYKHLYQSTLPPLLKLLNGVASYSSKLEVFNLSRNRKIWCRTGTDANSIVGITNIKHAWCDEAGLYSLYFWENIQNRIDFCGATVDLTTSPYAMNWIVKEIVKPAKLGKRTDVALIQASSWENPFHSLADTLKREAREATMDPRRFAMAYGGVFDRMQGLVYDCFDHEQNQIEAFKLPDGTRYFAGVDWGTTDPFVIHVRAITPNLKQYVVSEYYRSGLSPSRMVEAAQQLKRIFNIERFYCDPSEPGYIQDFNSAGLPSVGANNDRKVGIGQVYKELMTRQLKLFAKVCPHTLDELETYHYPEPKELNPDSRTKDNLPVEQADHAVDAWRYCSMGIRHFGLQAMRNNPPLKHGATREDVLKRGKRDGAHTEEWS